ncbi:hypothetical protein AGDE_09684 [Angomonas deanei]|uniref:Uncharacterized protein n=1 Tax=Angomonas deanei TaxID=59799 RepID=A0A7G2CCX6_9TRYP|nr:hypothetical protein AGDE_09684 [Angomonas deanei]CAD2216861.1 hypothetical protein, conserved [Angomonas deanei]|eukprot:EPY29958.1 hypothetical protein AGDE_09684 [Angomonas deanei]
MECKVFSPCGRFQIHFSIPKNEKLLHLKVFHTNDPNPNSPSNLLAVLNESQILQLTTSSGVRKNFDAFSKMMYNALIGASPCVTFFVETLSELKDRITKDVLLSESVQNGMKNNHNNNDASLIELSLEEDVAEEVLNQVVLTIDYNVDYTRALFTIPLEGGAHSQNNHATPVVVEEKPNVSEVSLPLTTASNNKYYIPSNHQHNNTGKFQEKPPKKHLLNLQKDEEESNTTKELEDIIHHLRKENNKLKSENNSLIQLSKEKMLEMQALCSDFQSRAEDLCRVDALKLSLHEYKKRTQQLESELEKERQVRTILEAELRASAERHPPVKSHSRGRSHSHEELAATVNMPYRRSSSREGRKSSKERSSRRPLLSPTPIANRSSSRQSSNNNNNNRKSVNPQNRFNTPPTSSRDAYYYEEPAREPARRRHSSGGDSPAPRGRTGNRPSPSASPSLSRQKGNNNNNNSFRSYTSSKASSRASSCERLYRTGTVSSRRREQEVMLAEPSAARRAIFR